MLAKHEVSGNAKQVALTPDYGHINNWCGSLDFEMENGKYSMGYINRRDVADSIRYLEFTADPPDDKHIEILTRICPARTSSRTAPK